MKTNILFACLISILSSYDACAAGAQQDSGWCCCRRAKVPQPPQDITPPLPAAVVAPAAPQPAAAGPQTPAPTAEEIAAQKKAAGASTVNSVLGEGWDGWLPSAAIMGIGGLSLTAQQQREAAAARIAESTSALTTKLASNGEQLFQMVLPAATEVTERASNALAPRVAAVTEQASSRIGAFVDSWLPPVPKQRTTYQRFCDDYMPSILVYGAVGGGITIVVRYGYYWFMGPQKTE